jgi:hypothetical protein
MSRYTVPVAAARNISPRQRLHVEKLLDALLWFGRKVFLDDRTYVNLSDHTGLERYQVAAAIDLAYALGVVDSRMRAGAYEVVELLSTNIDAPPRRKSARECKPSCPDATFHEHFPHLARGRRRA